MTTPTFNVGDTVRRKKSNANNRAYIVGAQPFEVKRLEHGFVIDEHGKRHTPFNLELVEKPAFATGGYVYGYTPWSPSRAKAFLKKLNNRESANWTGAPQHPDDRRGGGIEDIKGLQVAIARRNATIERQKAQLAEYAEQLEQAPSEADTLRDLQVRIGQANADKGFHEEGEVIRKLHELNAKYGGQRQVEADASLRNYCTARLALITTEVAEAIEELRNGRQVDETYYNYENDQGEDAPKLDPQGRPRKPEGVPSELADIVIRALDFAEEFGIDLAAMIEEKLAYNQTRGFRHGKQF